MATNYPNREAYSQFLDYRIFVISSYNIDELTDTTRPAAFGAATTSNIRGERYINEYGSSETRPNYTFYQYAIEEYVKNLSIRRSIDGAPATLDLDVFPVKDVGTNPDFNFYYKTGPNFLKSYPIFRKMDYVEVQVAELTYRNDQVAEYSSEINSMNKLLLNKNRSTNYSDPDIAANYAVRFRGFITDVIEIDSAEQGVSIKLKAKSILHFLATTQFISDLAMPNKVTQFTETQRAHLASEQYVVTMGDLLTNLKDATTRAANYIGESFQIPPTFNPKTLTSTELKTRTTANAPSTDELVLSTTAITTTFDPLSTGGTQYETTVVPNVPDGYFIGSVSESTITPASAQAQFTSPVPNIGLVPPPSTAKSASILAAKFLDQLETTDIASTTGTQSLLIPLTEMMLGLVSNAAANLTIYTVLHANLFEKELEFIGSNTEFLSNYTYLLPVLQEFKNMIRYFLYETADGQIHFERPEFDGNVNVIIDSSEYIGYTLSNSENGYFTDVYTLPGTVINILNDDPVRSAMSNNSGYTLDELRRYGYRRPAPQLNANIANLNALRYFSSTVKAINNSSLQTLILEIPYSSDVDLTMNVWFQKIQSVGYIVEMNETITYGERATMSLTLTYLRDVLSMNKDMSKINLTNVDDSIVIDTIPDYTFISDWFDGKYTVSAQTAPTDAKERSALGQDAISPSSVASAH